MRISKNQIYAILTGATLVAAYFTFSIVRPPKLEFQDRAFPQGFRNLVMESVLSKFDPLFGLPPTPLVGAEPKQGAQEVCDALFRDPDSPAVGSRDSEIQIAAFLDYRCPYCKTLTNIISKLQSDNIRIVYKEWPILGDSSVLAARAGLAANKQGKYLAFHTRMMNSKFVATVAYIEDIAVELGINLAQLNKDMNSELTTRAIQRTSTLASSLGFTGTPALIVGRTIVQGEITQSQLARLIENEILQPPLVCPAV